MFTGSTATGQAIIQSSADTVKRLTLELGGNDAGIVLPDVDPRAIAEGLFWGAFINTGQTCAALKRLYVHADVYDEVCSALVDVASAMPMGRGLDERTCSARCRTARSTTSWRGWSTPRATRAQASCSAATPTPALPATSTR
jgi:acyl-CoA reductase-like NAD-dependent aldehyde dehydrogenase